jgi:hypothetical protein
MQYLLGIILGVSLSMATVFMALTIEILRDARERRRSERLSKERDLRAEIWMNDLPIHRWDAKLEERDV